MHPWLVSSDLDLQVSGLLKKRPPEPSTSQIYTRSFCYVIVRMENCSLLPVKKVFISLLMVRFSLFHMIIIELSTLLCLKAESLVNNRFHTVVIRIYNMYVHVLINVCTISLISSINALCMCGVLLRIMCTSIHLNSSYLVL